MRISDWSSDVCSSDLVAADDVPPIAIRQRSPAGSLLPGLGSSRRMPKVPLAASKTRSMTLTCARYSPPTGSSGKIVTQSPSFTVPSWEIGEKTRSEEHTSELQSLMRISYAVFCLNKNKSEEQIVSVHNKQNYTTVEHQYEIKTKAHNVKKQISKAVQPE